MRIIEGATELFEISNPNYTRRFCIDNRIYCAYCGKELLPDYDIDGDDYMNPIYHCYCDCEDAKKEISLKCTIRSLERELLDMRAKYKVETKINLVKVD